MLFADRTSCHRFVANQFRVLLAAAAYVLVSHLRRVGLAGTDHATATVQTIRLKLFKVGRGCRDRCVAGWCGCRAVIRGPICSRRWPVGYRDLASSGVRSGPRDRVGVPRSTLGERGRSGRHAVPRNRRPQTGQRSRTDCK
ncbi:MAG: transposase [Gemmataceae bacterium]|nr:transposase [Gemmataceae bacterium]